MKIIDLILGNAFRRMRMKEKNATTMAEKLGLSSAHVGRILHGTTQYLSDETWTRIEPIITPYIRTDATVSAAIPPEVIREVMASACSAEEKAAIIRDLLSPAKQEVRREIPRPPAEETHKIRWHNVVECPKCGEDIIIPDGAEKFACPECGQRIAFAKELKK